MKVATYKEFQKLNHRLTAIEQKIDALAAAIVSDEQLAKLLADVKARSVALSGALAQ